MRAVYYVKSTTIPDKGNPSCTFYKVDGDGSWFEISAAGFHQARRKGATWFHQVVFAEPGWLSFVQNDLGTIRAVGLKSDPFISDQFVGTGATPEPDWEPPLDLCSWCGDVKPCKCPEGRLPVEVEEVDAIPAPAPAIRAHKPIRRGGLRLHGEAGLESGGPGEL